MRDEKDQALARRFQDEAWTIGELIATVRGEEQRNFVNNIAAVLDADEVEAFTALIMKAKASTDLNSEPRSALRSEAEIRAEERKAAFSEIGNLLANGSGNSLAQIAALVIKETQRDGTSK